MTAEDPIPTTASDPEPGRIGPVRALLARFREEDAARAAARSSSTAIPERNPRMGTFPPRRSNPTTRRRSAPITEYGSHHEWDENGRESITPGPITPPRGHDEPRRDGLDRVPPLKMHATDPPIAKPAALPETTDDGSPVATESTAESVGRAGRAKALREETPFAEAERPPSSAARTEAVNRAQWRALARRIIAQAHRNASALGDAAESTRRRRSVEALSLLENRAAEARRERDQNSMDDRRRAAPRRSSDDATPAVPQDPPDEDRSSRRASTADVDRARGRRRASGSATTGTGDGDGRRDGTVESRRPIPPWAPSLRARPPRTPRWSAVYVHGRRFDSPVSVLADRRTTGSARGSHPVVVPGRGPSGDGPRPRPPSSMSDAVRKPPGLWQRLLAVLRRPAIV